MSNIAERIQLKLKEIEEYAKEKTEENIEIDDNSLNNKSISSQSKSISSIDQENLDINSPIDPFEECDKYSSNELLQITQKTLSPSIYTKEIIETKSVGFIIEDLDSLKNSPKKSNKNQRSSIKTVKTNYCTDSNNNNKNYLNYVELGNSVDEIEEDDNENLERLETKITGMLNYKRSKTCEDDWKYTKRANLKKKIEYYSNLKSDWDNNNNFNLDNDIEIENDIDTDNDIDNDIDIDNFNEDNKNFFNENFAELFVSRKSRTSLHSNFCNLNIASNNKNDKNKEYENNNNNFPNKNINFSQGQRCNFICLKKTLLLIMLFILLVFDPIIIIILKIVDFFVTKFSKKNENEEMDKYININDLPYNINDIEANETNLTYYERYFNYFFSNKSLKKYRKVIKMFFIAVSLLGNILIISLKMQKIEFVSLFFLNNLYLLFQTMDLYNESLVRFRENVKSNTLINLQVQEMNNNL